MNFVLSNLSSACISKIRVFLSLFLTILLLVNLAGCSDEVLLPSAGQLVEFERAGPVRPTVDMDRLVKAKIGGGPYRVVPGDVLELTMPTILRIVTAERPEVRDQVTPYVCRVSESGTKHALEEALKRNFEDSSEDWQKSVALLDAGQCLADEFDWAGMLVTDESSEDSDEEEPETDNLQAPGQQEQLGKRPWTGPMTRPPRIPYGDGWRQGGHPPVRSSRPGGRTGAGRGGGLRYCPDSRDLISEEKCYSCEKFRHWPEGTDEEPRECLYDWQLRSPSDDSGR